MTRLVDINDKSLDDLPAVDMWHRVLLLRERKDWKTGGSLWPGRIVYRRASLDDDQPPRWWVYTEALSYQERVYHERNIARAIRIDTGPCENAVGPRLWVTLTLSALGGLLINLLF